MTRPTSFEYWYKGIVTDVYDADTVSIDIDLGFNIWMKDQRFRLYGIDAPEIRGDERADGLVARDWLRERILGNPVIVNSYKDSVGKYGRWLGKIYSLDYVTCYNDALVANGLAEYRTY